MESNEKTKQTKWKQTHRYREQTDSCQRGEKSKSNKLKKKDK